MIRSIKDISLKFLKFNKFIIFSSIFSIFLATILIISMFMFNLNSKQALKDELKETYGNMNLGVALESIGDEKINKDMIDNITDINGVEEHSNVIIDSLEVGGNIETNNYTIGVDNSKLSKSMYKYINNIEKNDVIISKSLADKLQVKINNTINIKGNSQKIVEILNVNDKDVIIMNIDYLKEISNYNGEASYLLIKLKDASQSYNVAKKIRDLNYNLRIDIAEENDTMKKNVSYMNNLMIFLSVLVIIMSSLFIISNFQTFLYKYRKQFAIIRSVGGRSKQAFKIVFIQSTIINSIGIIMGVSVSIFTTKNIIKYFSDLLGLNVSSIRYDVKAAIIITILIFIIIEIFMMIPAIRSSKILPLKIVSENEKLETKSDFNKKVGILGLIVVSVLFIRELYLLYNSKNGIVWGVAASIIFIISMYNIFPYYIKNILNMLLPILKGIGGNGAVVAIKNLIPQVKKNSIIIISLSTIIIIATLGSSFLDNTLVSGVNYIKSQYALDIKITDARGFDSILGREIKKELEAVTDIRNVAILSIGKKLYFKHDSELEKANYLLSDIQVLIDEGVISEFEGNIQSGIVLSKEFANKNSIKLGDNIEIVKRDSIEYTGDKYKKESQLKTFKVGSIIDSTQKFSFGDIMMDWSNSDFIDKDTIFQKAFVASNNVSNSKSGLDILKRKYPEIKYSTLYDEVIEYEKLTRQTWGLFIIMLITIIISTTLGIINIFYNNIFSKRKEYAILRTLKLTKSGIVRTILIQISAYIILGSLLGVFMGVIINNLIRDTLGWVSTNFIFSGIIILIIFVISNIIFIPFANHIANKKIADEIKFE
ncbi:MAG: FtsX-like permease family protein [Clostridium sp.]